MSTLPKWDEERVAKLVELVGANMGDEVPLSVVIKAAEELETTQRSVASKLRKMEYAVEKASSISTKSFTEDQEYELRTFVEANPNEYTYAEIAVAVFGEEKSAKQVQGKLLSMELTSLVKETEKKVAEKKYSEEEEATLVELANEGSTLEVIANKLNKTVQSVRGKALSLLNSGVISALPTQENKVAPKKDPFEVLGDVSEMTVAEIATAIEKSERGVKSILTHRGIKAKDYDGKARREKADAKKAA